MKVLYTLLLILVSVPLSAQTDRRISDTNRIMYPPDFGVQSMTTLDLESLVVFGSTITDPVTLAPVRVLRVQLLHGMDIPQRDLTGDPASRPSGALLVAPGDDRFFVAFKDDRADRPGLYLQTIGLDGANIGPAKFLSAQTSAPGYANPIFGFFGSPWEGSLIVWGALTSSGAKTYGIRIDPQGKVDGTETLLANELLGLSIAFSGIPQFTILTFQSSQETARLVKTDGRLDPRPISMARFQGTYFVGSDTSIATIEGGSLKIYGNIFDTNPSQTIALPTTAGIRPESWSVTRQASTNLLQISCLRVLDTLPGLHFAIERITVTPSGLSAPVRLIDSTLKPDTIDQMISSRVTLGNISRQRLCLQRYLFSANVTFRTVLPNRTNTRTATIPFQVDESGYLSMGDSIRLWGCTQWEAYSVERSPNDSISRVVVRSSWSRLDSVMLEHKRSKITVVTPERLPNIFERAGRILTTWSKSADSATWLLQNYDGTLADTPTVFARYEATGVGIRMPGAQLLLSQTFDRPTGTTYRTRFRLQLASLALWRDVIDMDQIGMVPNTFRVDDASYDPNRKEIVAIISRLADTAEGQTSLHVIDSNGTILWNIFSLPNIGTSKPSVIPAGDTRYIIVSDNGATSFDRENIVGTFSFASTWPDAHYQRLRGEKFLRWHVTGGGNNRDLIEVEIYDLAGNLIHSRTFAPRVHILEDPFVVENPADGSLAILHAGTNTGIRVIHQDSAFATEPLYAPVSAATSNVTNPAGAYIRDTLQVIWEDMRNGEPDIYGTWWTPSRASAVRTPGGVEGLSLAAVPNPASDAVSVSLRSPRGGTVRLELVDMRGVSLLRRAITLTPGTTTYRLDLAGVPPGAYSVIVHDAADIISTRIIVQ